MAKKTSDWQKHVGPFLAKAVKQARRSFKPKNGMTPARKKQLISLRKQRDKMNDRIRKLKDGK